MTIPSHPRSEIPSRFWQVQAVFDPDGTGQDFAYTIGLHTRGLPELHVWARPSLGEDPGEDWMLSTQDRCRLLNELADLLVAGRLPVGGEVTREYDLGKAEVVYRVDPPGDRRQLEAYGAPEGVPVLPVRWSLRREPEGELGPLAPEDARRAHALYTELVSGLDRGRRAPRGWTLPDLVHFGEHQAFGPLTPVVLARAAQLWQADDETLLELLRAGASVGVGHSTSISVAMAVALARPVGRRRAVARLRDACADLVAHLTTRPAGRDRWRSIARGFDPQWWDEVDREGRRRLDRTLGGLLRDVVASCLLTEAVADVAEPAQLLEGRGAWVAGMRREEIVTLPDWQASSPVQDAVRRLLSGLDLRGLTTVAGIHAIGLRHGITGAPGYDELCARLHSWSLVSASGCPWTQVISGLPAWQPTLSQFPGAVLEPIPELHDWATCLSAALVHRPRLSAEDVRTFALPYAEDLPRLRQVLDDPM